MNRSPALSLLRQCSASVSSAPAAVARRSVGVRTARALAYRRAGSRFYSTTQNVNKEKNEDDANGEKRAEGESSNDNGTSSSSGSASEQNGAAAQSEDPHTECLKKLKSKEDEVVDLTSRLRYLQADFLNLQRNAAREKEQTRDFAITRFAGDLLETVDVLQLALKSVPESALKASDDAASQPASTFTSSSASESSLASTSLSSTSLDSAAMSDSSTATAGSTPDSAPNSSPTPSKSASEYLRELHHGVEMTHRLLLQTLFKYGVKPFDPTGDGFDPNRHEALYQTPIPGKKPGTVVDCQKTGYTIKDRTLRAAQVGVASEPPTPSS